MLRLLVAVPICALLLLSEVFGTEFQVTFSTAAYPNPYTGRVYLFFGPSDREPRLGPDWFNPQPFCSLDVENWAPGQVLTLNDATPGLRAFPRPLAEMDLRGFNVQAVARFNPWDRNVGTGAGNGFSDSVRIQESVATLLNINRQVPERRFEEPEDRRLIQVPSKILSHFHQREIILRGGVLLPLSYAQHPARRYPVIFEIPGFGGTHFDVAHWRRSQLRAANGTEFIVVVLDPSCPLGHHAFADSANNGPWGTALVQEFIPALNQALRTDPRPAARFLTGHSSGGWSSLWLQVMYADEFNGTWSTSPDSVGFADFQQLDLLTDHNLYRDAQGNRRPLARVQGEPKLWFDRFSQMEDVLGYGGQLHSFEAVFSPSAMDRPSWHDITRMNAPPAPHPVPQTLWNRTTGEIQPAVARSWGQYDIVQQLERHWPEWEPSLRGKLTVIMGESDTFYLEGATRNLQQTMRRLGSDARIELVPGKTHFDLLTPQLRQRCIDEMGVRYRLTAPIAP